MNIGIHVVYPGSFDEAQAAIADALKTEGFGVLTEIDVRETFKKKLDVDFRRYKILGACNPTFARRALETDLDVGMMLPCNVVMYEGDDAKVHVAAIDPMKTLAAQGGGPLGEVAREVQAKLERAMSKLGERVS